MIEVLVVCDANYLRHAAVMLTGIFEFTIEKLRVHLVYVDIESEDLKVFEKYITDNGADFKSYGVDINDFQDVLPVNWYYSVAAYLKIFAVDLVQVEKVIYIDPDVLVLKSISDLWDTDLKGNLIGAVEEYVGDLSYLGLADDVRYFNSGVMLMNLAALREFGLERKFISYMRNSPVIFKYVDQDALNILLNGFCFYLPQKFNRMLRLEAQYMEGRLATVCAKDFQEAILEPVIFHYAGPVKPWRYFDNVPYKKIYMGFLKKTPWRAVRPEGWPGYFFIVRQCFIRFRRFIIGDKLRFFLKKFERMLRSKFKK